MSSLRALSWRELEDRLRELEAEYAPRSSDLGDAARLAHELHVHQVELEMQNRELVEAQETLEASRSHFAELYDRAPVGYSTLDGKGLVLEANLTAAGMLGLERSEVVGAPFPALLASAGVDVFFRALQEAVERSRGAADEAEDFEVETKYTKRLLQLTMAPSVSDSGNVLGVLMTMRDVTEEHHARMQRVALQKERLAHAEACARDRMKDQFLGVVSHELRAPLTAILGWLQILRSGRREEKLLSRSIEVMDRNAHLLARLVDDILDVSRIVAGKLQIVTSKVNLDEIVGSAIDEVRSTAQARNITLGQRLTPCCTVIADPGRMHQVVSNLLSNSIKFTQGGGHVEVALERHAGSIRLTVSDDGCGIGPEDLPHVFEHFMQAESNAARARSGLGLGLAIARYIVEAHAGTIVACSDGHGRGTTLAVDLPAHVGSLPPPAAELGTEETASVAGVKVLCVDDQTETLELIALMLRARGAFVRTASSAEEALALVQSFAPDVLLSDVAMPDQDGYFLVERVRQLPFPFSTTPAIAVTAYARSGDAERALGHGFASHVSKPVETDRLVEAIAALVRKGRRP